jgi:hypothetical protein
MNDNGQFHGESNIKSYIIIISTRFLLSRIKVQPMAQQMLDFCMTWMPDGRPICHISKISRDPTVKNSSARCQI